MVKPHGPVRRLAPYVAAAFLLSGCGKGDGLSDFDRLQMAQQNANQSLTDMGIKTKEINYPQGKGWSVNLSGMTITDDLLRKVKQLGHVTELDLSKSTITDDQLGLMNEIGLTSLLLKLDLSHTGVSDAGFEKMVNLKLLSQMNLTG